MAVPSAIRSGLRHLCSRTLQHLRLQALVPGLLLAVVPLAASAETVLEKALRTGELVMVGTTDTPPMSSLNAKGEAVGYAIEVGRRIDAELSAQLGGKVQIRFVPVANSAAMIDAVAGGGAGLACGVGFSWEREMKVDYTMPIGLSGLRLLTARTGLDGSPASLQGLKLATVKGSLGASAIQSLQPAAKQVSFESLDGAVGALEKGQVDGVLGDSVLLAGLRKTRNLTATRLLPEVPYATFGVGCILPQNNSDLANVANLAIARLQSAYLEGRPDAIASVDPWVGPKGVLGIPSDRIRTFFQANLLSLEPLVVIPVPKPAP